MRKNEGDILLQFLSFVILLLACTPSAAPASTNARAAKTLSSSKSIRKLKLVPSTILSDLRRRKEERPGVSPLELAKYGNAVLAQKGFNYDFDICELLPPAQRDVMRGGLPSTQTFHYKMALVGGLERPVELVSIDSVGMCGECYFQIPARRATEQSILVIVNGIQYQFKRPNHFNLDKVELVDKSLKKVLRTWHVPYQTFPAGLSPDGENLYLNFYEEYQLNDLLLELSADGSLQFKAQSEVELASDDGWLEDFPKDPNNAYLTFQRFHAGERSYIIKFSGPCT